MTRPARDRGVTPSSYVAGETDTRYRELVRRAPYAIYRAGADGRLVEANFALAAMLGYDSPEEMLGADPDRSIFGDNETANESFEADSALETVNEVHWKKRDGSSITVRLSHHSTRDYAGVIVSREGVVEDATPRARQDELLRHTERLVSLGHTLAGVAHELNNPLAAIRALAHVLLHEPCSDSQRSTLEGIDREAVRAATIVQGLLAFARPPENAARRLVDVNDVVRHIVSGQRYALETSGIKVALDLAPALPLVLAHSAQLGQVVLNLVVNARQALEETTNGPPSPTDQTAGRAPRITVRTFELAGGVAIEVSDNGPGIPTAALSKIWEPFWTTKPLGEGTGLGLSIAHRIVKQHEGTVEVTSEAGDGTRFLIRIPAAPSGGVVEHDVDDPRAAAGQHSVTPLDILVVDDQPSIREFLTRFFAARGHAVLAACDGAEALRLAAHTQVDVVICDLRMPGLDGAELVTKLRALAGAEHARYVVATGEPPDAPLRRQLDSLAIDAILGKPFDIGCLRRAVEGS